MQTAHLRFRLCGTLAALPLFALGLRAQDISLRGPVSGFVFDRHQSAIRPWIGVPGASYLGRPVLEGIDWAAVSNDSKSALAIRGGNLYLLRGLDAGDFGWRLLQPAPPGADRAVWNRDSSAVALYSSAAARVSVWRFSDGEPSGFEVYTGELPGRVLALALDRQARRILLSSDSGAIYLSKAGLPFESIAHIEEPGPLTLANEDRDLFVASRAGHILEVKDYEGSAAVSSFAEDTTSDPQALGLTANDRALIVAGGNSGDISVYNCDERRLSQRLQLDFSPSFLMRMRDSSIFLLTAGGANQPAVVFAIDQMSVYFVPREN
jgi:hypothetical protein